MSIKIYNTLTGKKEPLVPRQNRRFTMYTCGPTVYDSTHAGHLLPPVIGDVVKRYLRSKGYEVVWAHNFTDVEDKIIRRAQEEGVEPQEIAERYIAEYKLVLQRLGIDTVDVMPRVSEHIADIIEMIQGLIDKGYAYVAGGDVYFDVSKFPSYGKLSRRSVEELQAGARVEVDERKKNPADFALWKAAKPGEPAWESPWGPGRPGWHIECSVMAAKHLGHPVDIHGGGIDLVFPHHENEIAQSEAFAGSEPFVRYWLHSGLLQMNSEKMSKSLGNYVTAMELLDEYGPDVIRLYLLSHHYRSPREFSRERLEEAKRSLSRLRNAVEGLRRVQAGSDPIGGAATAGAEDKAAAMLLEAAEAAAADFEAAMSDDFNTAEGIAALFELARKCNTYLGQTGDRITAAGNRAVARALEVFEHIGGVLGIRLSPAATVPEQHHYQQVANQLVELLLEIREQARQERDWVRADHIRDRLALVGVIVEDTPSGPRYRWEQRD